MLLLLVLITVITRMCLFSATKGSDDRKDVKPKTSLHKPDVVASARKGAHHKHFSR